MIVVAGSLRLDPADRAAFLVGCVEVVRLARATDGCLDFALSPDLVDDGRVNVFELWATPAALQAFRGSGPSEEQTQVILAYDVAEYVVAD